MCISGYVAYFAVTVLCGVCILIMCPVTLHSASEAFVRRVVAVGVFSWIYCVFFVVFGAVLCSELAETFLTDSFILLAPEIFYCGCVSQ